MNEDDSIVLQLTLPNILLADATIAYHSPDYTLLGLQEFVDALEFPIVVDSESKVANGWFLKESNTFQLDLKTKELHLAGKKIKLDSDVKYAFDDFDLYFDLSTLEKWFSLELTLHMSRLAIEVVSTQALPVEERRKREKDREKNKTKVAKKQNDPNIPDNYLWLGPPVYDVQMFSAYSDLEGSVYGYSVNRVGDLLKHEAHLNVVQSDSDEPVNARFLMKKKGVLPSEDVLPGISGYEFGDIYRQGDTLINNSSAGLGIVFRKELENSLDRAFNARDFEGDAPPGWEVELFRNGLLIDFQVVSDNGRYIFRDVEVQYGENFFETRLYGPQGQTRVESQRVRVGEGMIAPGKWQYFGSIMREGDQLIGEDPAAIPGVENHSDNVTLEGFYGLLDKHSLGLGVVRHTKASTDSVLQYSKISLVSAYSKFSSKIDLAKQMDGGTGVSLNVKGRLFKQDFNLTHREFNEFSSFASNFGNLKSDSEINFFSSTRVKALGTIPYSFEISQRTNVSGSTLYGLKNRLSVNMGRLRMSNDFSMNFADDDEEVRKNGSFSVNYSKNGWQTRSNVSYDLAIGQVNSFSMSTDYKSQKLSVRLGTEFSRTEESYDARLNLGLSKFIKAVSVSLSGSVDRFGNKAAALNFDFGVVRKVKSPYIGLTRKGAGSTGSARLKVFIDNDADGKFSRDDTPIENVQFEGRSAWKEFKTDEDGEVTLRGIDPQNGTQIRIDGVTLVDPYLQATQPVFRLHSHAGALNDVNIPVVQTTEIEGYVKQVKNGIDRAIGGVVVALFKDGKEVSRVKTEFDGYYLIPQIKPGFYTTNIVDETGGMSAYAWSASEEFETDLEAGVTIVPDLVVIRKPTSQEAEPTDTSL